MHACVSRAMQAMHRLARGLSGGMQRRLCLAASLIGDPPVVRDSLSMHAPHAACQRQPLTCLTRCGYVCMLCTCILAIATLYSYGAHRTQFHVCGTPRMTHTRTHTICLTELRLRMCPV